MFRDEAPDRSHDRERFTANIFGDGMVAVKCHEGAIVEVDHDDANLSFLLADDAFEIHG